MPQARIAGLDGVRALAVLLVIAFHLNLLGIGWIGVQLFFVLSGFLITRLLLAQREQQRAGAALKTFYGRRALRIFPVYYLYLVLLLAALPLLPADQREPVAGQWLYAATYTYNWLGMSPGYEKTYFFTHLWSLAIEEQFYLLWPLLLFALPRRAIPAVLAAWVLAGPLLRYALFQIWPAVSGAPPAALPYAIALCTFSQVDAFAAGGLLCFAGARLRGLKHPGLLLAAALAAVLTLGVLASGAALEPMRPLGAWLTLGYPNSLPANGQWLWGYSALNLLGALGIGLVAYRGLGLRLLEHPALAYLGRISYGVYLFHFPLAHLTSGVVYRIHDWTGANLYLCILLYTPLYLGLLLSMAALSYELYERHFLQLKARWFPA